MVSEATVARLLAMPEGAPDQLDARCARLGLAWASDLPLCCARGAPIDARAKLALARLVQLPWSPEGPILDGAAPSGVIERLADVTWSASDPTCCGALDRGVPGGGVRGDGCAIRAAARAHDVREDLLLLDGCALFPLEVVGGAIVPSSRIPPSALREVAPDEASLWDDARARFAIRFGDVAEGLVDAAVRDLRGHRARALHLKTLR